MPTKLHVVTFVPSSDYEKMKDVYDACVRARIKVPEEVMAFFNHERPSEFGSKICLKNHKATSSWIGDSADRVDEGYQVDLSKLPHGARIIRFFSSF